MTYSTDFRRKVLEVKERYGLSFEQAAALFGVGKSSVQRWTECLEPCLSRNKPATKIDMELLVRDVDLYPDAYQYECAERFRCSQRGIGEALKRLSIGRKKNSFTPEGGQTGTLCFYGRNQYVSGKREPSDLY